MYSSRTTNTGFTLLELLVVITIIGLLATIVMASLSVSRQKSRDATRKSQIEEIVKAYALYYADNGTYQVSGTGRTTVNGQGFFTKKTNGAHGAWRYSGTAIAEGLAPFFNGLPTDPLSSDPNDEGDGAYQVGGTYSPYFVYQANANFEDGVCVFTRLERPSPGDLSSMTNPLINPGIASILSSFEYDFNYAECLEG